jgi:hypothetical protein
MHHLRVPLMVDMEGLDGFLPILRTISHPNGAPFSHRSKAQRTEAYALHHLLALDGLFERPQLLVRHRSIGKRHR